MRLKEDYMNNGQLKPGYNVQIAVGNEYIVGVGLYHNPTDTTTLIPFTERIQNQSKRRIENLIADAGYTSEENFSYLESHGQNAYIKPQNYEVIKTRKYKNDTFRPEHMKYNDQTDEYTCPNGKNSSTFTQAIIQPTMVMKQAEMYIYVKLVTAVRTGANAILPAMTKKFAFHTN